MSLSVDGTWKAGVWATTVWKAGVWREGAAAATGPEYRRFGVAFPPESSGDAPRLGDLSIQRDRNFYALAKLTEMDIYLQSIEDLVEGAEAVDLHEDPFRVDDELTGRSAIKRVNPRRRR